MWAKLVNVKSWNPGSFSAFSQPEQAKPEPGLITVWPLVQERNGRE
jgi:hypothetical protein